MQLLITLLYISFVLAAVALVVVVLLQEGKGGGLSDALGASGQATFGVGASGINRFTGIAAGVFLVAALLITVFNRQAAHGTMQDESWGQAQESASPAAGPTQPGK